MSRPPLVLFYHAFGHRNGEDDPHNHFVSPESFRGQLDTLLAQGWHPLSLAQYHAGLARRQWPRRSFLLTIDDGFVSTLEVAAPELAARGIPAVMFIPGGLIGRTATWSPALLGERLLDADGLRALIELGVDVGVHGFDHTDMRGMSQSDLFIQTADARTAVADAIGRRPTSFAYPSGWHDDWACAAVREAGFDHAFAITGRDRRYAISRVAIDATDVPRSFRLKLWRGWNAASRVSERIPGSRSLAHKLVGSAR